MQRCIIIEQSPIIRHIARTILTDCGFEVTEAKSGRDGIDAFDRTKPQRVLVDSGLTDMSVLDVLRHMRDAAKGRVQIIYCTTGFEFLDLQRAEAAGATDALVKPFDRASLQARLDAWRGRYNSGSDERPNRLPRTGLARMA